MTAEGRFYRPHHAILGEINRARRSVKLCLFLSGELVGDHNDSVVDALINAWNRGVDVQILFNGHVARNGRIGVERLMHEELKRPLLPAVERLKSAGLRIGLVYGQTEQKAPYSPIHSKYCVIDDYIVLDGSFNWYNTSVFSLDLLLVAANHDVARPYLTNSTKSNGFSRFTVEQLRTNG
jgi:phosphatidylserine/phosphatidylglycerophosphate/cardiolipin synthase-like enzyme